jgi:hypothetical protein
VSALSCRIEAQGLATTTIGLVRPHMEQSRPPRGLWVPFQLGRPLGEPEDKAFQRRVLIQALRLLERTDGGPVILEDFPDDPLSWTDRAGWRPAIVLQPRSRPSANDSAAWAKAVDDEIAQVLPYWEKAKSRFGRTMAGVSGQPPQAWGAYAAQFLTGAIPASPVAHLTPPLAVRHLADDLKALYAEAVQAEGAQPSARQINAWFWGSGPGHGTLAADLLRELRTVALTSADSGFKAFGSRFLVPAPFVGA